MLRREESIRRLSGFKQQFGPQFGIRRLGLFGSVARGDNSADSDVDIVVEVEQPTLPLMHNLRQSLVKLFGCDVDLVRLRPTLRPLLQANINRDAIYV